MSIENTSVELVFLRNVFSPGGWRNYLKHSDFLASSHPEDWGKIDFPLEIALELTNHCNLKCIMCPVPQMKRNRGFMDKELFMKVAREVSVKSGFLFLPQGFGELLLNTQWHTFLRAACEMGIHPIVVLTNGMLLTEGNIRHILDTADVVIVTVDGSTAETYESIRVNAKFNTVKKNIENFLMIRKDKKNVQLVLRIIRMKETENEIDEFRTFWTDRIGKDDLVQVSGFNDWTGIIADKSASDSPSREIRQPCRMLWKNLTIYHDGSVSPCCYDAEGVLSVGNVQYEELADIWTGPRLQTLRDIHLAGNYGSIPICAGCRNWL